MAYNKVIYGGNTLIDLTSDTVTADKLANGYTAHDRSGTIITGTMDPSSILIEDTTDEHGGTIRTITGKVVQLQTKTITPTNQTQVVNPDEGYDGFSQVTVNAGGSTINNQDKSVTPSESQQSVTADSGYTGLGTVTVNAISSTYVGSGVTKKAAATITPGTTNQTIASGTYLTGTQTIAGDADLVASNIVNGVQIFGVTGNVVLQNYYTGSSAPSSSLGSNGDLYLQS